MRRVWQSVCQVLRDYPRVLRLIWVSSPRYALLTVLLALVSSATPLAQVWATKLILDRLAAVFRLGERATTFTVGSLIAPVALIAIVWIIGGASRSTLEGIRGLLSQQVENHASYLMLRKAAELDVAFFETPAFFDRMNNARQDIWRTQNLAHQSIELLGATVSVVAMLGFLVRLHPLIVPLLVAVTLPQVVAKGYFANRQYSLMVNRTPSMRMASYISGLLGSHDAVKEIRLFGLQETLLKRFREFARSFVRQAEELWRSEQAVSLALGLLGSAGTAAVWGYAISRALAGKITIGDVALVFQAAEMARAGLGQLFFMWGLFYENGLFLQNLFTFLDLAPDSVEGALARGGESRGVPGKGALRGEVEFRNVSFRYPQTDKMVLRDVSFVIHSGETLAVVGENGAGKTTLVKLLARLYDPTEGVILLDGRDLREYDLSEYRRHVAVVLQDFVCYDLTVAENIGFGEVQHLGDKERIARAAELGGSRKMIDQLPKGFETMLGRTFDEGTELSGGEWQKLALSRAFMRDADILILDEPTASLDALAEYDVYQRFADLTSGKTTVFISHRFSTVRMAKHILLLKEGRLFEEGTHDELMRLGGQYAEMFNAQADRYR